MIERKKKILMETQKAAYYQTRSLPSASPPSEEQAATWVPPSLLISSMRLAFSIVNEILKELVHQEDAKNCVNTL